MPEIWAGKVGSLAMNHPVASPLSERRLPVRFQWRESKSDANFAVDGVRMTNRKRTLKFRATKGLHIGAKYIYILNKFIHKASLSSVHHLCITKLCKMNKHNFWEDHMTLEGKNQFGESVSISRN